MASINVDGKSVPFRNDAQEYGGYNKIQKPNSRYVLNDSLSRGIRRGVNKTETAIGQGIYKMFPKQKSTLDRIADFASKKGSIADKIGLPSYKKGGKVKKTGLALVHKGERVLTKEQAKVKALKKMKNGC